MNLFPNRLVHSTKRTIDAEKDSFIFMNEFEQESHSRTEQRA